MHSVRSALLLLLVCCAFQCRGISPDRAWPPEVQDPSEAPILSPEASLEALSVAPGFRVELVASEPLVEAPVEIEFDPDGRLWVVEMRGYMPNIEGKGELKPIGRVSVLEDQDGDGRMDRSTVFLDSLVLPRALHVLHDGVLVGEPPYLWFARDLDGDLVADEKELVSDEYGSREANPEHTANGLLWGLDNWIHSADYGGRFRRVNGTWEHAPTLNLGQWGISMDDFGRFYRNWNSDPLRADAAAPHYYLRNPNLAAANGIDQRIAEDMEVWPIRTTRGVNRGYRERELREDGTLRVFTAAGSPVIYRGDRFPAAFYGNVFVTEPSGNLVRRFVVTEDENGAMTAVNPYEQAEFLASTDERFRPVNLYSGPDGALYVVDMYRGIIQHSSFLTHYLQEHIRKFGLEQPLSAGRIYRVVHEDAAPAPKPQLSEASGAELVEALAHPNGWWRDTAQRLLVGRGDASVAPALHRLARSAPDERTRLHALWTLQGLQRLDADLVRQTLSDASPRVRVGAVRLAEPWLTRADGALLGKVTALADDPAPLVRLQVALSLGEAPPEAAEPALAALLTRFADQPFLVEAAVSGLAGRELEFLDRLLCHADWQQHRPAYARTIQILAAAVLKEGDPQRVERLFGWAAEEEARPQWQRLALLEGIQDLLPSPRNGVTRYLQLDREPAALTALLRAEDPMLRAKADTIAGRLTWPGKETGPSHGLARLTPEARQLFEQGKEHYLQTCAACHQASGEGIEGVAAPLVGSEWVLGTDRNLIRILLHGKEGERQLMPPQNALSDEEIAAILTYIRNDWGNEAAPVTAATVRDVRGETASRARPWTEAELRGMLH